MTPAGLVLFAHGARDPRWREPFDRLQAKVQSLRPDLAVSVAFFEFMQPGLVAAADALAAQGCTAIRVVPVFLGQGGHVREDLPELLERVRAKHPQVALELRGAIGEDDAVLGQIAAVALTGL